MLTFVSRKLMGWQGNIKQFKWGFTAVHRTHKYGCPWQVQRQVRIAKKGTKDHSQQRNSWLGVERTRPHRCIMWLPSRISSRGPGQGQRLWIPWGTELPFSPTIDPRSSSSLGLLHRTKMGTSLHLTCYCLRLERAVDQYPGYDVASSGQEAHWVTIQEINPRKGV